MNDGPKYEPLEKHLSAQPLSVTRLSLSFSQISSLLSSPLPLSAYKYKAWWTDESADTTHVQSRAWMQAGWTVKAEELDLLGERVTFRRG